MLILNQRRAVRFASRVTRARHANSVYATRRGNARRSHDGEIAVQYGSIQIRACELTERDSERDVVRVGDDNWLAEIYFTRITYPMRLSKDKRNDTFSKVFEK